MPVVGAGFVTVIVPVATVQPGWAAFTVGGEGAGILFLFICSFFDSLLQAPDITILLKHIFGSFEGGTI